MSPYKSPHPDGYFASVFQAIWEVLGDNVCHSVLKFLNDEDSLTDINQTYITLIPKVKEQLR